MLEAWHVSYVIILLFCQNYDQILTQWTIPKYNNGSQINKIHTKKDKIHTKNCTQKSEKSRQKFYFIVWLPTKHVSLSNNLLI